MWRFLGRLLPDAAMRLRTADSFQYSSGRLVLGTAKAGQHDQNVLSLLRDPGTGSYASMLFRRLQETPS